MSKKVYIISYPESHKNEAIEVADQISDTYILAFAEDIYTQIREAEGLFKRGLNAVAIMRPEVLTLQHLTAIETIEHKKITYLHVS